MKLIYAVSATSKRGRPVLQNASQSQPRVSRSSLPSKHKRILQLQQTIGNRATLRLLESERRSGHQARIQASRIASSPGQHVQRYESGEHAKLGDTQSELSTGLQTAYAPLRYTVSKQDTLESIASRFDLTVEELKDANKDKLHKLPGKAKAGHAAEGFKTGETISIPQKLNDFAKAAVKDKAAKFTVNGVVMDYGVGIAMGDLFESPEQMAQAPPQELQDLAALILREKSGQNVTQAEWQKATKGRYLALAEKNNAHFAPQNAAFAPLSAAGAASENHQTTWQKHHAAALQASQQGDKDRALATNSFADHFLTDAFSAGHLVNKADVMEQLKSHLQQDKKGDFLPASKAFFDGVAASAFTGALKDEFSDYETVDTHYGFHPNIDSESRFSTLLQEIHKQEPNQLANLVTKGVHDKLNTLPGGLPVENANGDKWMLSGDGTLNADSTKFARQAVAQSQMNVIGVYSKSGPLDLPPLFKKVWDYTPQPTKAGSQMVAGAVALGTDIGNSAMQNRVAGVIKANYKLILDELVVRKKLRKA